MIRVLVVDDEAPARRKLLRLLRGAEGFEVVGEAADGATAVQAIRTLAPDLVFLDVRMPAGDGLEVVRQVGPSRMPHVVFVTAYDEYALEAFEVEALDYLLKPVSPSRFAAALERARRQVGGGRSPGIAGKLDALLERLGPPPKYLERLLVEADGRGHLVSLDRVDRIEAARNYVRLHVAGGTVYEVRRPIGDLADRLDPSRFLRLNRSEIVRLEAVREFQSWFHRDSKVILKDGTELTWSRRYRARQKPDFALE